MSEFILQTFIKLKMNEIRNLSLKLIIFYCKFNTKVTCGILQQKLKENFKMNNFSDSYMVIAFSLLFSEGSKRSRKKLCSLEKLPRQFFYNLIF